MRFGRGIWRLYREAVRNDPRSRRARSFGVVPGLARPGRLDPAETLAASSARASFRARRRRACRLRRRQAAVRVAAGADRAFDGRRDRAALPAPPSRAVPGGDPVGADARPAERPYTADLVARADRPGAFDAARPLP